MSNLESAIALSLIYAIITPFITGITLLEAGCRTDYEKARLVTKTIIWPVYSIVFAAQFTLWYIRALRSKPKPKALPKVPTAKAKFNS